MWAISNINHVNMNYENFQILTAIQNWTFLLNEQQNQYC